MNPVPESALAAEARARVLIDGQLAAAGWVVQDTRSRNLSASQGVARREAIMATGHGRADYLLYLDRRVVGVIEAKPVGTPLSGVEWQSAMYATGLPAEVRLSVVTKDGRLPFVFEASGTETHFTNGYYPEPRSRRLFAFPRPETLARLLRDAGDDLDDHVEFLDRGGLEPATLGLVAGPSDVHRAGFDQVLVDGAVHDRPQQPIGLRVRPRGVAVALQRVLVPAAHRALVMSRSRIRPNVGTRWCSRVAS